jgi:N-glycosylase/DNA lyase
MHRFEIVISRDEFDVGLCVQSGQVFRWTQAADHSWVGVDGERWFIVKQHQERIQVSSSAEEGAFRSLFSLDRDWAAVRRQILEVAPELEPHLETARGLRLMRPTCPREVFFCFLCTANNHLSRIRGMVAKLAQYGTALPGGDGLRRFPTVESVAAIPEAELRAAGFGYRGRTIPAAARDICRRHDPADRFFEILRAKSYEEAHEELCALPGVGPKLADCICLYGLGFDRAVPVDTHLWQAMTRLYFPDWSGKALTPQRYRQAGDYLRGRFGDLAGIVHFYLYYENLQNWRGRRP